MRAMAILLLLHSTGVFAADQAMTWKEANKRSSDALFAGDAKEGQKYARLAFELYEASPNYTVANHAQLLLNLAGTRLETDDLSGALTDINQGLRRIEMRNGGPHEHLVAVLEQSTEMALARFALHAANAQYSRAASMADRVWGPTDERSIAIHVRWADELRQRNGRQWADEAFDQARKNALAGNASPRLLTMIDLQQARLAVESRRHREAIPLYRRAIHSMEQRAHPAETGLLVQALAQLEFACKKARNPECEQDARARYAAHTSAADDRLIPLIRVQPEYPQTAADRGLEGVVEIYLHIAADGTVTEATVRHSDPPGVFDQAALDAVRKWTFKPKVVDGQPVPHSGLSVVQFTKVRER